MHHSRPLLLSLLFLGAGCSHGASDESQPPTAHNAGAPTTGATAEAEPRDVSETPSDLVVTQRIRTMFEEDSELAHVQRQVVITTAQHVVTLTGNVATDRQRLVMAAHARATEGVEHLDNQIQLAP